MFILPATGVVIRSTGLKVYGKGEWKVRQHGLSKRRTWEKLHLTVCPDSHEIILEVLTENKVTDCEVYPILLNGLPKSLDRAGLSEVPGKPVVSIALITPNSSISDRNMVVIVGNRSLLKSTN